MSRIRIAARPISRPLPAGWWILPAMIVGAIFWIAIAIIISTRIF